MPVLARTYSAYGASAGPRDIARTAYAGELRETATGWYLLGERPYNPTLRRFLAPDSVSPFARGGINRYAYCSGDPVNRIDPSGRSWLGWLGASLGLTQRRTGAAGSVPPTSQGMHEAASTPATLASTTAALADAVTITSALDSVALMTSENPKAAGLFGWFGMGATVATGGSALPAARNGSPTQRISGRDSVLVRDVGTETRPRRNVEVVRDQDIPAHRLMKDRRGRNDVTRNWTRGIHTANPRSQIWAVDSPVNYTDFPLLFKDMAGRGITHATVYSGVDGHPYGTNWDARTGFHVDPVELFYLQDLKHTKPAGASAGMNIEIVDVGDIWKQELEDHLSRDGVHVIGSCYGIADPVVMEALNLSNVTVYYLPPGP